MKAGKAKKEMSENLLIAERKKVVSRKRGRMNILEKD